MRAVEVKTRDALTCWLTWVGGGHDCFALIARMRPLRLARTCHANVPEGQCIPKAVRLGSAVREEELLMPTLRVDEERMEIEGVPDSVAHEGRRIRVPGESVVIYTSDGLP